MHWLRLLYAKNRRLARQYYAAREEYIGFVLHSGFDATIGHAFEDALTLPPHDEIKPYHVWVVTDHRQTVGEKSSAACKLVRIMLQLAIINGSKLDVKNDTGCKSGFPEEERLTEFGISIKLDNGCSLSISAVPQSDCVQLFYWRENEHTEVSSNFE